jgi:hypothetical protein
MPTSNRNPIQYTSRDYDSILNDINSTPTLADKPSWFKRLIAGVGDVLSIWLNAAVNDLYLRTAFTRQSVADLCTLVAYTLATQTTSTGTILFYVDTSLGTAIFPFTATTDNLRAKSQSSLTISSKTFEARASELFSLVQSTFTTNFAVNNALTVGTDLLYTGHKVRLTSTGTLPTPLQIGVDYYVIYSNATTIYLATTLADALVGNQLELLSNGSGTHTLSLFSKGVTCYQQDSLAEAISIGQSDGVTSWQEFVLPDQYILPDTLTVTINSLAWTEVSDFTDSTSSDRHYKIVPLSDNQLSIRFGNDTYGDIPPANFDINVSYSTGGGQDSNVSVLGGINSYAGNDPNLTGASNPTVFNGGSDEESLEDAKNLAPLQIKVRDRFITVEDGVTLALGYGGLSLVKINRLTYGPLSCQVVAIAEGGSNPSPALRATIQQFLIDRTILESIDVRFEAATITAVNVTSSMKVLSGYTFAGLLPYFRLAYKLLLTETGKQIVSEFEADGVAAATTLLNSLLGEAFGTADYTQIQLFLENLDYRNFGDVIQESEVVAFIQSFLIGCDHLTIASFGSGFPLVLSSNEITTVGSLTLTEIP